MARSSALLVVGLALLTVVPRARAACFTLLKNQLPSSLPKYITCHTHLAPTSDYHFVDVLGLPLLATHVREPEIKHAANVMAKWLDNDEDGVVDDPKIATALAMKKTLLWLHGQSEGVKGKIHEHCYSLHGGNSYVDHVFALSAVNDDTNKPPGFSFGNSNPNSLHLKVPHTAAAECNDLWDATLEETFHLLTDGGAAEAYPQEWEDNNRQDESQYATTPAAKFVKAVKDAGDYDPFGGGPANDPNPKTIVGEGIHFSMLTLLGAFNFTDAGSPLTYDQWKVADPVAFEKKYPDWAKMLRDKAKYPWLPQELPDGNYKYGFKQQSNCATSRPLAAQCPFTFPNATWLISASDEMFTRSSQMLFAAALFVSFMTTF
eukprot:TRINITY_DN10179_c0_g1_i1.p1 TRINITY_DN10179_c0_g1~~TRINITY_DN10179_c0_g1_i1.p1  ORF type:complete len:375 (+),score=62.77 TRINITY_DN10179_c0_g1_i1:111-1235(+)